MKRDAGSCVKSRMACFRSACGSVSNARCCRDHGRWARRQSTLEDWSRIRAKRRHKTDAGCRVCTGGHSYDRLYGADHAVHRATARRYQGGAGPKLWVRHQQQRCVTSTSPAMQITACRAEPLPAMQDGDKKVPLPRGGSVSS